MKTMMKKGGVSSSGVFRVLRAKLGCWLLLPLGFSIPLVNASAQVLVVEPAIANGQAGSDITDLLGAGQPVEWVSGVILNYYG